MNKGNVSKIIPFSSVDGPGNRTAIFLQGCNFNCLYCHNPETINYCNHCGRCVKECPYNALSISDEKVLWDKKSCKGCDRYLEVCQNDSSPKVLQMRVEEVLKEIKKVRPFISGVTVSGGECTLQTEFIISLFKEVKKMGLTAFIDTNGSLPLYENKKLLNIMDMAMLDVKSYDPKEHKRLTGRENQVVLKNVKYLADMNKLYEVRTVIVPKILNNYYNVDMISKLIASIDSNIRYKLIKYRQIGVRKTILKAGTPTDEMMEELKNLAIKNGCKDVIIT